MQHSILTIIRVNANYYNTNTMILIKFKGLHVAIIIRLIKIFKREKGQCSFSSINRCIVVQIKSLRMPP